MPLLPMGPPQGGGPAMPPPGGQGLPLGAPPPPGLSPLALPPTPAAQAGLNAMQLVPEQQQQQAALTQQQVAQVLAMLMDQLGNQPNPAAEAAQSEPAGQVAPDAGLDDSSMTQGGQY